MGPFPFLNTTDYNHGYFILVKQIQSFIIVLLPFQYTLLCIIGTSNLRVDKVHHFSHPLITSIHYILIT